MMMNDAKKKITSNSNNGDFSGSLQSTPLTRDLIPRSTIRRGRSWVNYRIFIHRVVLHDTTNKKPSRHHQQRILTHIDDDELPKIDPIGIKARDRPPT
jgi:hypothetical protein